MCCSKSCQANNTIRWLDRDSHFVAVVGAGQVQTVRRGTHGASKNQPALGYLSSGGDCHRESVCVPTIEALPSTRSE